MRHILREWYKKEGENWGQVNVKKGTLGDCCDGGKWGRVLLGEGE